MVNTEHQDTQCRHAPTAFSWRPHPSGAEVTDSGRRVRKKVVFVTWTGNGNFGTMLQACALGKALSAQGYKASLLAGIQVDGSIRSRFKAVLERCGLLQPLVSMLPGKRLSPGSRKFAAFRDRFLKVIRVRTSGQLEALLKHTDVFLTGSDQVWNAAHDFNPFYFLDFAGQAKRVSYAPSLGTPMIPARHAEEVRNLLERYAHISVRERSGRDALAALTGRRDIVTVMDPVFLLGEREWLDSLTGISPDVPKPYILCYLVGSRPGYCEFLRSVRARTGITQMLAIPSVESGRIHGLEADYVTDAGPSDFIRLIQGAAIVCTDSFHAVAMSMIFRKNFVVLKRFADEDPSSQNSRLADLLDQFGLQDRWGDAGRWENPVDFSQLTEKIREAREASLSYLVRAIEQ